jgi:hypothetical protein
MKNRGQSTVSTRQVYDNSDAPPSLNMVQYYVPANRRSVITMPVLSDARKNRNLFCRLKSRTRTCRHTLVATPGAFKAIPATGYHVFQMGDFGNIGQLARDLNVDGVLVIYHHFAASSSDNDLSNAQPGIISVVGAFDRAGKTVLQDYTSYTSRVTVRSKPGRVDIGGVTRVLVAEGDEAGRNFAKYITGKLSAK